MIGVERRGEGEVILRAVHLYIRLGKVALANPLLPLLGEVDDIVET